MYSSLPQPGCDRCLWQHAAAFSKQAIFFSNLAARDFLRGCLTRRLTFRLSLQRPFWCYMPIWAA
jgi:hypothetical protein